MIMKLFVPPGLIVLPENVDHFPEDVSFRIILFSLINPGDAMSDVNIL